MPPQPWPTVLVCIRHSDLANTMAAAWNMPLVFEPHILNTYVLLLAEVVAAWVDVRLFSNSHWHLEWFNELRTIHHVAGGNLMAIGEAFKL